MTEAAGAGSEGLLVVDVRDAAARGGLRAGDRILAVNDARPLDILDLEDAAADGTLWLTVLHEGRPLDLVVAPRAGEWHGISLDHGGIGDRPRVCRNACRFCFVDQLPEGLRAALAVKDDDYRLSFLHGNFITLTNLSDADLARIETLRLSPLYISLHAWDDEARVRLMGRAAAGSRATLQRLAAAGLELHLQVVLCPDWNDGSVLAETVAEAGALPEVADLGVVPVSLAAEGDLRRVTAADAQTTIAAIESWQRDFRRRRGDAFVHAADELYLLADRRPPPSDAAEQFENGVGIAASTLADVDEIIVESGTAPRRARDPIRLLGGRLAEPLLAAAAERLSAAGGVRVRPFTVANELFGPHVTVSGLLGGREVLEALRRDPLADGEWLAAPRSWLPADLGVTLDDITAAELEAACNGRLAVAESLGDAFARLWR